MSTTASTAVASTFALITLPKITIAATSSATTRRSAFLPLALRGLSALTAALATLVTLITLAALVTLAALTARAVRRAAGCALRVILLRSSIR